MAHKLSESSVQVRPNAFSIIGDTLSNIGKVKKGFGDTDTLDDADDHSAEDVVNLGRGNSATSTNITSSIDPFAREEEE